MKRHILIAFVTAMLLILAIYAGCSALSDATDLPTWTEPVTGMEFVLIPGGWDLLGRTEAETRTLANRFAPKHLKRLFGLDLPQREVHVESFWLARHEVTQKAWATIMGGAPKGCAKGEDLPVSFVTWKEAKDFILTLNTLLPDMKFRLPTEEEWEYACRAGSDSPFNTGESIDGDQANFKAFYVYGEKEKNPDGRYQGKPLPVGSFRPNAFGLFDMHGNVMEWTSSIDYDHRYSPADMRVLRGGSYDDRPSKIRSSYRRMAVPLWANCAVGFRLARNK